MSKRRRILRIVLTVLGVLFIALGSFGFYRSRATRHEVKAADIGTPIRSSEMEKLIDEPGPIEVETVVGADWQVPLSGLVNLESEKAKQAGFKDKPEPIQVYLHAIKHPTRGLYIIDTGVERRFRDDPEHALVSASLAKRAGIPPFQVKTDTKTWLEGRSDKVQGVFFTHLHIDHVSGLRDVPNDVSLYTGPNEATERSLMNVASGFIVDTSLEGKGAISEWKFSRDEDGSFEGVLDVFGDQSFFAIWVPGHTAGSTAYLARTPKGPVLFTGDACHTVWGWENEVEPGSFSEDKGKSAASLKRLEALVKRHPKIDVRLGHQAKAS